jgi:hypothetical protein
MAYRKSTTCILATFAVIFPIGLLYFQLSRPMLPAVPWHIRGQVVDKSTNALSLVKVSINAGGEVTGINRTFGTEVKRFRVETATDEQGRFNFEFRAVAFQLGFSKPGFMEVSRNFQWVADAPGAQDSTNQNLQILMEAY